MPAMPVEETRVSKTAVGFSGVVSTAAGFGAAQPASAAATAAAIGVRILFSSPYELGRESYKNTHVCGMARRPRIADHFAHEVDSDRGNAGELSGNGDRAARCGRVYGQGRPARRFRLRHPGHHGRLYGGADRAAAWRAG